MWGWGSVAVAQLNKTTGNSCLGTGVTSGRLIHRQNDTAGATVYPGLGLTAAGDFIIGTLAAAHMQQHKVDEWYGPRWY